MTDDTLYDLAFVVTTPPNAGFLGQETFDLAVSGGVFDQRIMVVFAQQGLLHLTNNVGAVGRKSLSKLWQSAELFGVERLVAVIDQDLQMQADWPPHWSPSPLMTRADTVTTDELSTLLQTVPRVMVL
ncbi:MAG: DsrE family protein [Natronospirillum sp.]